MSWYSILPEHLTVYETWAIRFFLLLSFLNIAPWLIAIIFDFLLWIYRLVYHIIPVYGGRARGQTRPRAPSVRDAHRKRVSLVGLGALGGDEQEQEQEHGHAGDGAELRRRRDRSRGEIDETEDESEGDGRGRADTR